MFGSGDGFWKFVDEGASEPGPCDEEAVVYGI